MLSGCAGAILMVEERMRAANLCSTGRVEGSTGRVGRPSPMAWMLTPASADATWTRAILPGLGLRRRMGLGGEEEEEIYWEMAGAGQQRCRACCLW